MTILAALLFLVPQKSPDQPLQGAAAKCGTEIPWTTTLAEAQKKARETDRPIAWWVPTVPGSPMDRKLVIQKYMLSGPFMMKYVVEILTHQFVPLRLVPDAAAVRAYGLEPLVFIEPGLVFLDADLKVIHKVDRITTFNEDWFILLLQGVRRQAHPQYLFVPTAPHPGRVALSQGRPDPELWKGELDEVRWFRGVALHLTGRDEEGRAEWRKIKEGRWAWKAAAELARDGPFVRGFETYESLPQGLLLELPTGTTQARKEPDVDRAVRFLLQMQRGSGVWDDSHYNFGGDDSLPNVYMAVTALAALALRESAEESRIQAAVRRAEEYMKDESHVAERDSDEIAWAHAYRLLYFARTGDKALTARLVKKLGDLQRKSGVWYHEYENPFVTATVLHALDEAKKAGCDVPEGMIARGVEALRSTRNGRGVFSYGYPGKGGDVGGGAGRMPFCEFALLLGGASTKERVSASLATSFEHHGLLERVRKYDDHADAHRNGGFFFWYDQYGRALGARAAGDASALARQKEIVLSIPEFDGCWMDSHELGRVYGTAMALLTLKLCEK